MYARVVQLTQTKLVSLKLSAVIVSPSFTNDLIDLPVLDCLRTKGPIGNT